MQLPCPLAFDAEAAYRAVVERDARVDGRLFVGVTSTRIYCRPICRVRTPRREHCRFFSTAAQAEAAAFRPCLKCRPELAPGAGFMWSVMDASSTLARQAAQWLDDDAHIAAGAPGEAATLAGLAARLGVSDRHLRRIFAAEHGVSPLQYLQTRRLLRAKQLLTDTPLPVTQVALASGFRSLRRFNAVFSASYRMSPTRLRRGGAASGNHVMTPLPVSCDVSPAQGLTARRIAPAALDRACTAQAQVATPLGEVLLARTAHGLSGLWFAGQKDHPGALSAPEAPDDEVLCETSRLLEVYFRGEPVRFDGLPLDLIGTPFQRSVWQALCGIDRGATATYGQIARQVGAPAAVRAVGAAVGRNPVSVIVPCHRVIGAGGGLTGYAGGLDRKMALLRLEGALA